MNMQNKIVRILFLGDVFAQPGRKALKEMLSLLISQYKIDFTIANGENIAGGSGITHDSVRELYNAGVQCVTTGNHVWRQKEGHSLLDDDPRVLRPANYPKTVPGCEYSVFTVGSVRIGVFNLLGRVYMDPPLDSPFEKADAVLELLKDEADITLCDFHAEATSEKVALGWYLDGRITAVVGTHTHIQTADERILDNGTAYITDVGMTGSHDSVIGVQKDLILTRFLTGMPVTFKPGEKDIWINGVIISCDPTTGKATAIERVQLRGVDKNGYFVKG